MGGYILLQEYLTARSDRFMNELISQNLYNPNTLIELKIKQNVPGIREWDDFKNVSGQVQLKNACYNYVKLKVTQDTLFIMCVPNYEKTRLIKSNIIYAKQISDIPTDKKGQEASSKKADNKYDHPSLNINFFSFKDEPPVTVKPIYIHISDPLIATTGQPPEVLS
jgi:hypothetical protein